MSIAGFSWQKIQPLLDQVEIYLFLSLLTSPDIKATLEELSRKRKEFGHSYKGDPNLKNAQKFLEYTFCIFWSTFRQHVLTNPIEMTSENDTIFHFPCNFHC